MLNNLNKNNLYIMKYIELIKSILTLPILTKFKKGTGYSLTYDAKNLFKK